MKKRQKTVSVDKLFRNEKKIGRVIHAGRVKNWVGIGWVTEREATVKDRTLYPVVVDSKGKELTTE